MANTRKRAIKEEPDTKKVARVKTEYTRSSKPTAKTAVKAENDLDSANSTDLNVLNGLTVQQPFASAIIFGPKRIECRKQPLKIKDAGQGRWLAIHCGKSRTNFNDNTYELTKKFRWEEAPSEKELMESAGKIIGLAHFFDSCSQSDIPDDNVWKNAESCNNRIYAWSIDKVIPLEKPIAHTGQLGLWKVKEDIAKDLLKLIK